MTPAARTCLSDGFQRDDVGPRAKPAAPFRSSGRTGARACSATACICRMSRAAAHRTSSRLVHRCQLRDRGRRSRSPTPVARCPRGSCPPSCLPSWSACRRSKRFRRNAPSRPPTMSTAGVGIGPRTGRSMVAVGADPALANSATSQMAPDQQGAGGKELQRPDRRPEPAARSVARHGRAAHGGIDAVRQLLADGCWVRGREHARTQSRGQSVGGRQQDLSDGCHDTVERAAIAPAQQITLRDRRASP